MLPASVRFTNFAGQYGSLLKSCNIPGSAENPDVHEMFSSSGFWSRKCIAAKKSEPNTAAQCQGKSLRNKPKSTPRKRVSSITATTSPAIMAFARWRNHSVISGFGTISRAPNKRGRAAAAVREASPSRSPLPSHGHCLRGCVQPTSEMDLMPENRHNTPSPSSASPSRQRLKYR